MRVIITGATSLIGVALCEECLSAGYEVSVVVRPNSKNLRELEPALLGRLSVVELDLCDMHRLPELLKGPYDAFFHLAWLGTDRAGRFDWQTQAQNITLTVRAVEAAAAVGCRRFVGAGSQAEYGPQSGLLSPDTLPAPTDAYGAAKLAALHLSRVRAKELSVEHLWARIFSVYGPHDNKDTLITALVHGLMKNEPPELTPCEQLWDYLYVSDAAVALRLIAEKGRAGAVYCLGSGQVQKLSEYVREIVAATAPNVTPRFGAKTYSANQVMHLQADITALTRDTGFLPAVPFSQGIDKTVQWLKKSL